MFGGALQRARVQWIKELPPRRRALILGEGDGRFVRELSHAHPGLAIDCLDESTRMLELARRRMRTLSRERPVQFIRQNILQWQPTGPYDLLVTHFVLDCFVATEVEAAVAKLARAAAPDAVWLLADFTMPAGRWAWLHARLWLRVMYTFFRVTAGLRTSQLVDATPYLRENGFTCRAREVSRFGMLKSEMWVRSG